MIHSIDSRRLAGGRRSRVSRWWGRRSRPPGNAGQRGRTRSLPHRQRLPVLLEVNVLGRTGQGRVCAAGGRAADFGVARLPSPVRLRADVHGRVRGRVGSGPARFCRLARASRPAPRRLPGRRHARRAFDGHERRFPRRHRRRGRRSCASGRRCSRESSKALSGNKCRLSLRESSATFAERKATMSATHSSIRPNMLSLESHPDGLILPVRAQPGAGGTRFAACRTGAEGLRHGIAGKGQGEQGDDRTVGQIAGTEKVADRTDLRPGVAPEAVSPSRRHPRRAARAVGWEKDVTNEVITLSRL